MDAFRITLGHRQDTASIFRLRHALARPGACIGVALYVVRRQRACPPLLPRRLFHAVWPEVVIDRPEAVVFVYSGKRIFAGLPSVPSRKSPSQRTDGRSWLRPNPLGNYPFPPVRCYAGHFRPRPIPYHAKRREPGDAFRSTDYPGNRAQRPEPRYAFVKCFYTVGLLKI